MCIASVICDARSVCCLLEWCAVRDRMHFYAALLLPSYGGHKSLSWLLGVGGCCRPLFWAACKYADLFTMKLWKINGPLKTIFHPD